MLKSHYRTAIPSAQPDGDTALGGLCFSAQRPVAWQDLEQAACLHVAMPTLDGHPLACEYFEGDGPIQVGKLGQVHYRCNDAVLFGLLALEEDDFASQPLVSPLQAASKMAYEQIFAVLKATGFTQVFRFWNYMADINASSHGLERYRQFNLGRQQAFTASGQDVCGNVPAACALGAARGPLTVAFIAGRVAAQPVENPRQVSAYDYPTCYGPSSPLFSRASLVRGMGHGSGSDILFLSGTASILGHATLHAGDVLAQTRETITNIAAVLEQANRQTDTTQFGLASLDYKVYVRHPADLESVRSILAECIGPGLKAIYLQADICRADLLVEIEGTAGLGQAGDG